MRLPRMLLPVILLFGAATSLLSIGIGKPWRLLHEDTGAFHTSLALSHLRLGLARTRAHGVFFNPRTGATSVYAHHPPGPDLVLAAAFGITGHVGPRVARSVAILFHPGSLALFLAVLRRLFLPIPYSC